MSLAGTNYSHVVVVDPAGNEYLGFVGAFTNGDDIYVGYTRAYGDQSINTAPTPDIINRAHAPNSVYTAMGTTFENYSPSAEPDGSRDCWDLDIQVEWLRSTDHGLTFSSLRSDDMNYFMEPAPGTGTGLLTVSAVYPQATIRLPSGDWLRRINGEDIKYAQGVPPTCYIERLVNGTGSWIGAGPSGAQCTLGFNDPTVSYQISRIRRLANGTLVAVGQNFNATAGSRTGINYAEPLVHYSVDNGFTWYDGLVTPANWTTPGSTVPERIWPGEGDVVELDSGALLSIWRSGGAIPWDGTAPVETPHTYVQTPMAKTANYGIVGEQWWTWGQPIFWPAASGTGSGPIHMDLLKVRTGDVNKILFFARGSTPSPSAFYYTENEGTAWSALSTTPTLALSNADPYYPRSVVTYDGLTPVVNVFGHYGEDNYPGELNNQLRQHRFTLPDNTTEPPGEGVATVRRYVNVNGQFADLLA